MRDEMTEKQEAINAVIEAVKVYSGEYEFRGEDEDGRDGSYTPTEDERLLIHDAIAGLLLDEVFLEIFNTWQDLVRKEKQ